MKKLLSTTALTLIFLNGPAAADLTFMFGISMNFGSGQAPAYGITSKVLTGNQKNKVVGAAGATYFFDQGGYFGLDAGIGYTLKDSAITLTYDFLNNRPQLSAGWADIC